MREVFGTFEGQSVERVTISGGGLTVKILNWGATIQDMRLEGHAAPLVLGFDRFEDYPNHSQYFGSTVGRYANRIANGRAEVAGDEVQLDRNQPTGHHLHGGHSGISHRLWQIDEVASDFVRLSISDKDGQSGYPGNCSITCEYRLRADGTLDVTYQSQTDRPTLANIAHHSYFNLDGSDDVYDHRFMIMADHYLPVGDDLIPTGEIADVEGTVFDLKDVKSISSLGGFTDFDHNYCVSKERTASKHVASVEGTSGVALDVFSGEPGVQFYSGGSIKVGLLGLDGRTYKKGAGFCLETQIWPDAPNHEGFPNAILMPGEILTQKTIYQFTKK